MACSAGEDYGSRIMELLIGPALIILIFSMEYWGPGVRNILNAISVRISGTESSSRKDDEMSKPLLGGKAKYVMWMLALPAAVWFAIQIWEWVNRLINI